MDDTDWTIRQKPYDLRERLFLFACLIVRLVQFLHTRGPVATALSYQILKSGTSAGANYEEADDASSPRDELSKKRIALRELKETLWRLRVARASGFLTHPQDPVIRENDELVRIVATVIRNSAGQRALRDADE
jgi:four helix bundle protein